MKKILTTVIVTSIAIMAMAQIPHLFEINNYCDKITFNPGTYQQPNCITVNYFGMDLDTSQDVIAQVESVPCMDGSLRLSMTNVTINANYKGSISIDGKLYTIQQVETALNPPQPQQMVIENLFITNSIEPASIQDSDWYKIVSQ